MTNGIGVVQYPISVGSNPDLQLLVLSSEPVVAEALASVLGAATGLPATFTDPCAVASCNRESFCRALVLVDLSRPDGLAAVPRLGSLRSRGIVLFGVAPEIEPLIAPMASNVACIVSCRACLEALLDTINRLLSDCGMDGRGSYVRPARLTEREIEILGLIAEGQSNREIAETCHLQTATVKNHVHRILGKLGAKSRAEAAVQYRRQPTMLSAHGLGSEAAWFTLRPRS